MNKTFTVTANEDEQCYNVVMQQGGRFYPEYVSTPELLEWLRRVVTSDEGLSVKITVEAGPDCPEPRYRA